jgi:hypothetical protein
VLDETGAYSLLYQCGRLAVRAALLAVACFALLLVVSERAHAAGPGPDLAVAAPPGTASAVRPPRALPAPSSRVTAAAKASKVTPQRSTPAAKAISSPPVRVPKAVTAPPPVRSASPAATHGRVGGATGTATRAVSDVVASPRRTVGGVKATATRAVGDVVASPRRTVGGVKATATRAVGDVVAGAGGLAEDANTTATGAVGGAAATASGTAAGVYGTATQRVGGVVDTAGRLIGDATATANRNLGAVVGDAPQPLGAVLAGRPSVAVAPWLPAPAHGVAAPTTTRSPANASTARAVRHGNQLRASPATGASLVGSWAHGEAGTRGTGMAPWRAASGQLTFAPQPGGWRPAGTGRPSPERPGPPPAPASGPSSSNPSGHGGSLLLAILAGLLLPPALALLGGLLSDRSGGSMRAYRPALLPG